MACLKNVDKKDKKVKVIHKLFNFLFDGFNNLWITFTLLSFLSTFFKQAKKLDMTCLKSVFHRFHRPYYYYYPSNTKNK